MIGPNEIKFLEPDVDPALLDEIEEMIDESIKKHHPLCEKYEQAVLYCEYPVHVRNLIAHRYINGGWNFVYHGSTADNNEKPGITRFVFSMDNVDDSFKNYYKLRRDNDGI